MGNILDYRIDLFNKKNGEGRNVMYTPQIEAYRNQREADLVLRISYAEMRCDYNERDRLKTELAQLRKYREKTVEYEDDDD